MVQCAAMAMLLALLAAPLLQIHTAVAQGDPYCDRAKNSKLALSMFMTAASSPDCYNTEVGAMWSVIDVQTYTKQCSYDYTISGNGKDYSQNPNEEASKWRYATSSPVMYKDASGNSQSWQSFAYSEVALPNPITAAKKPVDFAGFSKELLGVLPQQFTSRYENTPVQYKITMAADKGGMMIVSPPTKCTFTYRVTSGSFASLVPVKPAGGLEGSCAATPGTYQPTIAGAKTCAICPAGTFSSSGASAGTACKPCSAGSVPNAAATASGSAQCQTCAQGLKPDATGTSCKQACYYGYVTPGIGNAAIVTGNKYNAGSNGACQQVQCPNGTTVNAKLTACIGAKNGQLCQYSPNGARNSCGSGFKPEAAPPVGGAALTLLKADTTAANCGRAVAPLAQWLSSGNRLTWMGYDLTGNASLNYGTAGADPGGVQWQLLGPALPTKILQPPTECGRASGGPGPQLAFTQSGVPLDVNALLFTTILADSMPITSDSSSKLLTQGGWGIIATAGSEPNTISTTWFQDSSFGTCGITSFTAAVPSDTCTLTFKVVAGSVLGVSAPDGAKCPAGTHPVTHPDNTQSCFACSAGYAFKGGKCMACSGNFYQPNWGDVPDCKPCKGGGYATSFDATSNWFCYSNETPRFKDN